MKRVFRVQEVSVVKQVDFYLRHPRIRNQRRNVLYYQIAHLIASAARYASKDLSRVRERALEYRDASARGRAELRAILYAQPHLDDERYLELVESFAIRYHNDQRSKRRALHAVE